MSAKIKIVINSNSAWSIVNFRSNLIRALVSKDYEVVAFSPSDSYVSKLQDLGCRHVPLLINVKNKNPIIEALFFIRIFRLLWIENPNFFLGFTIKPNLYGSLAAHLLNIPVINNITGLGVVFKKKNWLTNLVKIFYYIVFKRSKKVFFQNKNDKEFFISSGLVRRELTDQLPGSGVNLNYFKYKPMSVDKLPIEFLLIARLIIEKGVIEYVNAAKLIRKRAKALNLHPKLVPKFNILGFLEVDSPGAISNKQMNQWVCEGDITYLGETDDVRPYITAASCIVLPSSYREGVPRTLLEAAAIGRPIITTNEIGCRDVVVDGLNGYICKSKNVKDLAKKMESFTKLSHLKRIEMGRQGRKKMELEFNEKIVINKYLDLINKIYSKKNHKIFT
jgi:glycosyltransferase involved in cell wall biosynthesis